MNSQRTILLILITLATLLLQPKQSLSLNPYKVLNVPSYATFSEIKERYKEYAKKYHPDKNKEAKNKEEARKRFSEINEAYDNLKKMRNTSDDDVDDNHLLNLIFESIFIIIGILIYYYLQTFLLRGLLWLIEFTSSFAVTVTCFYHIFDRYFDHWFDNEENKLAYIGVSSILFLIAKYFFFRSSKKVTKEEKKD